MNEIPKCPNCKSNANVKELKGCRCMSCPPWACMSCPAHVGATYNCYEFWDDEEEED